MPSLPPLGPGPTPPLAPLTVALAAYATRRNSETNRTQNDTPAAQLATNSLTTGIPGLDAFFTQQAASFDHKFHNQTPTATPTEPTYNANGTVTGNVGAHDADGDRLTDTVTTQPTKGTVTVDANGNYTYTPTDPTLSGDASADSFTVTVSDNTNSHSHGVLSWLTPADEHTVTVSIGVEIPNPAPVAHGPATVSDPDPTTGAVTITPNITDPNDTLTYSVTNGNGTLVDNHDGTLTYTPDEATRHAAALTPGADTQTITIVATDSAGQTAQTTAELTVLPYNQAPGAVTATNVSTDANGVVTGTFVSTDPDGDAVKYSVTSQPTNGTIVVDETTGNFTYTPANTYAAGAEDADTHDEFEITATDTIGAATTTELAADIAATNQTTISSIAARPANKVVFTADGRTLIASSDGVNTHLTVIDTATGEKTTYDQEGTFHALVVSDDGKYIAFASDANTGGTNRTTFATVIYPTGGVTNIQQEGQFSGLTMSDDGKYVVLVSDKVNPAGEHTSAISFLDTETRAASFHAQAGRLADVEWTADQSKVIAVTEDGDTTSLKVYNPDGTVYSTGSGAGNYRAVVANPDGSKVYLATLRFDSSTTSYTTFVTYVTPNGSTTAVQQAGVYTGLWQSPTGEYVVVTSQTGNAASGFTTNASIIDADTGYAGPGPFSIPGNAAQVIFSPNGSSAVLVTRQTIAGVSTTRVTQLALNSYTNGFSNSIPGAYGDLVYLPDNRTVVVATSTGAGGSATLTKVDMITGTQTALGDPQDGRFEKLLVTPDGSGVVLVTFSGNNTASYTTNTTIRDAATGEITASTTQPGEYLDAIVSDDGEQVLVVSRAFVSGGGFKTYVKAVDLTDGTATEVSLDGDYNSVARSDDGKLVVLATTTTGSSGSVTHLAVLDTTTGSTYAAPEPLAGDATDVGVQQIGGDYYVAVELPAGSSTTVVLYRNPVQNWAPDVAPLATSSESRLAATTSSDTATVAALPLATTGVTAVLGSLQQQTDKLHQKYSNRTPTATTTAPQEDPDTGVVTGAVQGSDADGDRLVYTVTKQPANGTVFIDSSTGEYTYTPNDPGQASTDTFTVTVSDNTGSHSHGIWSLFTPEDEHATTIDVGVTVTPIDRAPVKTGEATASDPDPDTGAVTITTNITDPDGDALTYSSNTPGTLTQNSNGTVTFTPSDDARHAAAATPGTDTMVVELTATDPEGLSVTTSVTIEIAPHNEAPDDFRVVIDPDTGVDSETGAISGFFVASDPEGDNPVTYTVTKQPTRGTLVVDENTGAFTYTPDPDERYAAGGSDEEVFDDLEITATDSLGAGTTTQIGIRVLPTDTTSVTADGTYVGVLYDSPDGRHTLLVSSTSTGVNVAVVDIATGRVSETHTQQGALTEISFDAAGDRAYVVTRGTGETYVSAVDVETGDATPVQTVAGTFRDLAVAADGDNAYLVVADLDTSWHSRVYVVDGTTGTATKVLDQEGAARVVTAGDGEHAFVISDVGSETYVTTVFADTAAHSPTVVLAGTGKSALAPDGSSIVVLTSEFDGSTYTSHVTVIGADGNKSGRRSTSAAVGARFKGTSKSGKAQWSRACTFAVVDEPRELVWITHGGIFGDNTEWRYALEPHADGTHIVQSYRILAMPVWFDRLVWRMPPAHHDRREALRGDLTRLARLAEA